MTVLASSLLRDLKEVAETAAKYPGASVRLEPFGMVIEVSRTRDDGRGAAARQVVSWEELGALNCLPEIVGSRIRFMHAAVLQQTA